MDLSISIYKPRSSFPSSSYTHVIHTGVIYICLFAIGAVAPALAIQVCKTLRCGARLLNAPLKHSPRPEPPGSPLGVVSHTAHRVRARLLCFCET